MAAITPRLGKRSHVVQIVGVDCATRRSKVGLALGRYEDGGVALEKVVAGNGVRSIADTICEWLDGAQRTLLALDAPLGWPSEMGEALVDHFAGGPLPVSPDTLFRRQTDRVIQASIGRRPLDVGADRIARTAHSALTLLEQLRQHTGEEIPVSWHPGDIESLSAIEVYPAATLTMYAIQASGYKKKGDRRGRGEMVAQLAGFMRMPEEREMMIAEPDVLDAAVCVLAGADYLAGRTIQPPDDETVRKEGWIWVRSGKTRRWETRLKSL